MLGIPNILATGVWVALTILIGVTLGRIVWVCASEILAFGREDKVVTIGDGSIGPLTQKLYDTLTGIQWGRLADPHDWIVKIDG